MHVVASINPLVGGPAQTVPGLARALGEAGVQTVLATLDYPASGPQPDPEAYALESQSAGMLTRALRGWNPGFQRRLGRIAADGVSVVHGHGLWMFPNLYARQVAVAHAIPLVISPRGMLEGWALNRSALRKAFAWRLFERENLRRAALFHATSEREADSIRAAGFRQPIACIPNGVPLPGLGGVPGRALLEGRYPDLRGKRWMLFMSRLHPVKGLPQLLQAWKSLEPSHPGWQLLIAGSALDGYGAEMRRLSIEAGLERRTTFSGMLSGADKACALGNSELFVLPTHSENFGVAVAEALSYGIPAVTTRAAPWPALDTNRCGWWIEAGAEPLRLALAAALEISAEDLRAMGARGRQLVASRYAWARVAEDMKAAYQYLLGRGNRPGCVWSGA